MNTALQSKELVMQSVDDVHITNVQKVYTVVDKANFGNIYHLIANDNNMFEKHYKLLVCILKQRLQTFLKKKLSFIKTILPIENHWVWMSFREKLHLPATTTMIALDI